MKFYKKILLANPLYVNGKKVQFDDASNNIGCLAVDESKDELLAIALDHNAKHRTGGIVVIGEAEYDELKKKQPSEPSAKKPQESPVRVAGQMPPKKAKQPKQSSPQQGGAADAAPAVIAEQSHMPAAPAESTKVELPATARVEIKPKE